MALIVKWVERRERWMQTEEAIEVNDLGLRDGDGRTHRVVVLFRIGHDDVEAVGSSTLKDDDQAAARVDGCGLGEHGADKKAGDRSGARDGEGSVAQEESPVGLHGAAPFHLWCANILTRNMRYRRWNSGEPSKSPASN